MDILLCFFRPMLWCLCCLSLLSASSAYAVNSAEFKSLVQTLSTTPAVDKTREIRIAIVYPGLQSSDYWQRSIAAFRGRLDQLGIRYELDVRFSKPHVQQDLQETQILEILEKDPDYLVYTVNSVRQRRTVESLLGRAKPKLIIQNLTRPIQDWYDFQPLIYVGFDHAEGARKLAEYYRERFSAGTEYGILFWDRGVVSEQRGLTFEHAIGNYHRLKASYFTDASRLKAKEATLRLLKEHPNIRYLYACATDVALGALDALTELGREDVSVNGWGGGKAELTAFRSGLLDVVLMRMNDQNGIAMAEAIRLDMTNRPVPQVYSGDFKVLVQGMSHDTLNQWLQEAFIYSGIEQ